MMPIWYSTPRVWCALGIIIGAKAWEHSQSSFSFFYLVHKFLNADSQRNKKFGCPHFIIQPAVSWFFTSASPFCFGWFYLMHKTTVGNFVFSLLGVENNLGRPVINFPKMWFESQPSNIQGTVKDETYRAFDETSVDCSNLTGITKRS